jgi:hypothetical protein
MRSRSMGTHIGVLCLALLTPASALASEVHAVFDLDTPTGGPFPSDRFTVADARQLTGLRVNLPKPDCQERVSDCQDLMVINTLDGFNVQPRLSIPFDGIIDVNTVTSDTVFLVRLRCGLTARGPDRHGRACDRSDARDRPMKVGINQIVWDTLTNTLHVESDELLEQHTQYALIVTIGVRDDGGSRVGAAETFRRFRQSVRHPYKAALLDAVSAARQLGIREQQIVVASVFTTLSVTRALEQIRRQIEAATPEPADFFLAPGDGRTIFPLSDMTSVVVAQQTGTAPTFTQASMALNELRSVPGAVGRVAFGKFSAPDYLVHPGEFIPSSATRTGSPRVLGINELYFNLVLPSGTPPPAGWPVAIAGHGGGGNKEGFSLGAVANVSAAPAARGIASIHINFVGHGLGALSTLTVNRATGAPVTFPAGGRGHDQDGDGTILSTEGRAATSPWTIVEESDGIRQSIADLMQLVRLIQVGIDADGDSVSDLDASRIYFFGQSLGAIIGTTFLAAAPDVRTGVLTAGGGPWTARVLSPSTSRTGYAQAFARRIPSLINSPGVTHIDEVPIPAAPTFNENMPLRDGVPLPVRLSDGTSHNLASPVINSVPGASEIQAVLEQYEWVQQWANPVAYAPHLRTMPLAGVPQKTVLIQFARGDQIAPNPMTTSMLRAGDLADRATLYRHDLASAENPSLPKPGHGFAYVVSGFGDISLGAQEQIATFFESDGATVIHPEPGRFFEVPVAGPLPEDLSFIP